MFDLLNFEPIGWIPEPVVVSHRAFGEMYEYSRTTPTGKTPGKTWRRLVESDAGFQRPALHEEWWRGKFVAIPVENEIGLQWNRLLVAEGVILGAILDAFGLGAPSPCIEVT